MSVTFKLETLIVISMQSVIFRVPENLNKSLANLLEYIFVEVKNRPTAYDCLQHHFFLNDDYIVLFDAHHVDDQVNPPEIHVERKWTFLFHLKQMHHHISKFYAMTKSIYHIFISINPEFRASSVVGA